MKIGNIIALAAGMLGKYKLEKAIKSFLNDGVPFTDEEAEQVERLIFCYNLVISELTEERLALVTKESVTGEDGKIRFENFSKCPIKIKSVTKNGMPIAYKIRPEYIETYENEVEVEYEYAEEAATSVDDEFCYKGSVITERVCAEGVAAEFAITAEMLSEAVMLRERFIGSVEQCLLKARRDKIKGRAWC